MLEISEEWRKQKESMQVKGKQSGAQPTNPQ
jgi:hypothetical protein